MHDLDGSKPLPPSVAAADQTSTMWMPELGDWVEVHIDNQHELLIYLLVIEITFAVVEDYINENTDDQLWRPTLAFFEEQAGRGICDIDVLIATAFLYYLPYRGSPGDRIVENLGPVLAGRLAEMDRTQQPTMRDSTG